ncbi:putative zinc protease [Abditibacteriota bacterium]|nr:putative zinc protease [Abditibacteriota bacterium]
MPGLLVKSPRAAASPFSYFFYSMQAQFKKTTLPNGVRVLTEKVEGAQSASIGIWFEAGCAFESEREQGLAHLLEHMVFKGTKRHSMWRIAKLMDDLGGGMNAFTEREFVCFHVKVLGEHLREALALMCEFATQPLLDEELLEIEKGVVLEEIRGAMDAPEERVEDLFLEQLWPASAWGRPILGQSETVSALGATDLRDFMNRFYSPSRCVVAVTGAVDHAKVARWVEQFSQDLPKESDAGMLQNPPVAASCNRVERDDTEGVHLLMGAPTFGATDERRFSLWLLDSILTGGYSSRLFQEVREKRGLCYSLGGASANFRAGGYWALETSVAPENARKTVAIIGRELAKIREDGVKDSELKRAKRMARINMVLSEESLGARMSRLARNDFTWGAQKSLAETLEMFERVSLGDIQDVARQVFRAESFQMVALGPLPTKAKLELVL